MQAASVCVDAMITGTTFISVFCGFAESLLLPALFDAKEGMHNWPDQAGCPGCWHSWAPGGGPQLAQDRRSRQRLLADAKPQVHPFKGEGSKFCTVIVFPAAMCAGGIICNLDASLMADEVKLIHAGPSILPSVMLLNAGLILLCREGTTPAMSQGSG